MDTIVKEKSGLYIEQMYTGCLAEAAYYIESNGEAVVIDPMRETAPYLEKAAERGARIKYVFETHFHADFVSGHANLAHKTGAQIVYGPTAQTEFDSIIAVDGQEFEVGNVKFRLLHTPGHTLESSSYLLLDEEEKPYAVFTGDTLFIGEVGRPDLAQKGAELTIEDLAGMMYDSLRNKLMTLPDEVIVYPAHGAGSACGKNISDERWSTIGQQKLSNYALQPMSKEEFIPQVSTGILPPPQYFPKNAALNKQSLVDIDELLEQNTRALSVDEMLEKQAQGALVLDIRTKGEFVAGFVPGSLFIGLNGSFASWVGTLIEDLNQPIVIISPEGREREAALRLARVGYHNCVGYLKGGFAAWQASGRETDSIETIDAADFPAHFVLGESSVVDVRKPGEFASEHVEGAISYPLDFINAHLNDLDKNTPHFIHCLSGFRSVIAASILKREGYSQLVNVDGGFQGIAKTDIPRTDYVCPNSLN